MPTNGLSEIIEGPPERLAAGAMIQALGAGAACAVRASWGSKPASRFVCLRPITRLIFRQIDQMLTAATRGKLQTEKGGAKENSE